MKRTAITFLFFATFCVVSTAQQRVALREGLVIHPTQPVAYVMAPEGGVSAVDLGSGATTWTSTAADKPLALSGNMLVSQAAPPTENTNRLDLVALNVTQRGAAAVRNSADLPAGVRVALGETIQGRFNSTARPADGSVIVTWSYLPALYQGRDEETFDRDATLTVQGGSPQPTTGTLRMNVSTGAMSRMAPTGMVPPASSTWSTARRERLAAGVNGGAAEYESADGRHTLASDRIADDRVWEKYRWTVFEKEGGRKVGETRSHVAFAPFVVRGSTLVFETTPYIRGNDLEPAKLRGVNLETGRETWSVEVREVVYRGPMPP